MTHRFFVDVAPADAVHLAGDQARQIGTVLRLGIGDQIILVADGTEHDVCIESVAATRVTGRVTARRVVATEPPFPLTLALPLLKGDRSEEIVEAATQLGVARFVPFVAARSVVSELSAAKLERWRRIARESAETARRGSCPAVVPLVRWAALADQLEGTVLVCWEEAQGPHLRTVVPSGACTLVIGPEGGLGGDEVTQLVDRGAVTVSLGPRNLRAETAAITAVGLIVSGWESGPDRS